MHNVSFLALLLDGAVHGRQLHAFAHAEDGTFRAELDAAGFLLDGDLDGVIDALITADTAEKLQNSEFNS